MNDNSAVINYVLMDNRPDVFYQVKIWFKIVEQTDIPISQTMPIVASEVKIFARTSQEWRTVSPVDNYLSIMSDKLRQRTHLQGSDRGIHIR